MEFLLGIDRLVFLFINHLPHSSLFDSFANFLSGVGTWGFVWILIVFYLFFREEKRDHWFFLPSAIVSVGIIVSEFVFKALVARPRPTPDMGALIVGYADNFSFPSSHATIAFAFAYILSLEEPRWRGWLYAFAALISLSRVYLGVHYPLDIIAGGLLGVAIGAIARGIELHWSGRRRTNRRSHRPAVFLFLALVVVFGGWLRVSQTARHAISDPLDFRQEQRYLEALFARDDPVSSYSYFTQTYAVIDPSVAHDLAHVVGGVLFRRFGQKGIVYCGSDFEWGCYHGLLSQAIASGIPASALCTSTDPDTLRSCRHGLGHGLLLVNTYTIPGLERALDACQTLGQGFFACAGGVFMEYNTGRSTQLMGGVRDAATKDKEKIYEPCQSLSLKYQSECFLDQPPRWFIYTTQDPKEIIRLCSTVGRTENRRACYRGIARITPGRKTKADVLREFCQPIADADGRLDCQNELGI